MVEKGIVKGFVFEDEAGDGKYHPGVKGLSNVLVTNQLEVVATDERGYFELPLPENGFIIVTQPNGYRFPVDAKGQPQYFYRYFSKGTPSTAHLDYPGVAPTGPLPEFLNFPLQKVEESDSFQVLFVGDIQPICQAEIGYFRDLLVGELASHPADFMVLLGDLVWDKLDLFPEVIDSLSVTGHRWYPVCGNHDINLEAREKRYTKETFKGYLGPTYYSFDRGKVHFIVLDDIGYDGWDVGLDEKGLTKGWLDEKQLNWLENDLRYVANDKLIFLMSHIPVFTQIAADHPYRNIVNRDQLFEVLRNRQRLYSISAHTHFVERLDLKQGGWPGKGPFPALIAGAACGAWWKGPLDTDGIPVRMGLDGTPNGYFLLSFSGTEVEVEYFPAGKNPVVHQMGIRYPKGDCSAADLKDQEIIVNIYRGHPESIVVARIDHGPEILLNREVRPDPWVTQFLKDHHKKYPEWMQARMNPHLWVGRMPADLSPGIHTIEVVAREPKEKKIRAVQPFRVLAADVQKKVTRYPRFSLDMKSS